MIKGIILGIDSLVFSRIRNNILNYTLSDMFNSKNNHCSNSISRRE